MRRFVVSFFGLSIVLSVGVAAAILPRPPDVQQIDHSRVLLLVFVAVVQLLLIVLLFRSWYRSKAAEAALRLKEQELITDEMEAKTARLEIGGKLIRAQEEERSRIARELHDDINQRMALLANGLEKLRFASRQYPDAQLKSELGDLWTLTNEIAGDIQQLSHRLHPSKLHYLGLATAVRDLCLEFSRQHGTEVECNVSNLPHDLDDTVSLSLFRTIQESLRNVAKHSQARHVKVELSRNSTHIKLRISDDGVGFDPDKVGNNGAHMGLGLISMRERLRFAGGELHIWSRPSLGTQVEGRVPAIVKRSRTA